MDLRYSRQCALPQVGEEGQRRLAAASVFVVGAGGLGAPILLYLAAMGVGHIGFVDDDVVSLSNLQRQILYDTEQVGRSKATEAAQRLKALNPTIRLTPYGERLTSTNAETLLAEYDVVVDACDNFDTRLLVDSICQKHGIPYVYGSVDGFQGQVSIFHYQGAGSYADFLSDGVFAATPAPHVPGALPGVVGSIQALEVMKLVVGCGEVLAGKLLILDLLTHQYATYRL